MNEASTKLDDEFGQQSLEIPLEKMSFVVLPFQSFLSNVVFRLDSSNTVLIPGTFVQTLFSNLKSYLSLRQNIPLYTYTQLNLCVTCFGFSA